mmetsp:Transcript_35294/g.48990  ORF Transcript_35294/g.48990 Transcript_35294/m.48990 type:complete len:250 (-) Transcript_35294:514-1263(-)
MPKRECSSEQRQLMISACVKEISGYVPARSKHWSSSHFTTRWSSALNCLGCGTAVFPSSCTPGSGSLTDKSIMSTSAGQSPDPNVLVSSCLEDTSASSRLMPCIPKYRPTRWRAMGLMTLEAAMRRFSFRGSSLKVFTSTMVFSVPATCLNILSSSSSSTAVCTGSSPGLANLKMSMLMEPSLEENTCRDTSFLRMTSLIWKPGRQNLSMMVARVPGLSLGTNTVMLSSPVNVSSGIAPATESPAIALK